MQLSPEHGPTIGYEEKIRAALAARLPTVQTFFRPADATSQTLAGGAALVENFYWTLYLFAAFLIATGVKMLFMVDFQSRSICSRACLLASPTRQE